MRAYHSASSIKIKCDRAWAYCYVDRLRDAEIPWEQIEAGRVVSSRERSLSLGKAVHAIGEAHYRGEQAAWHTLPGMIFASGAHLLPRIEDCVRVEVETPIGQTKCDTAPAGVAMPAHGVLWAGFRDLLCFPRDGAPIQVDYKTTSRIASWALDEAELARDVQCALYTLDACNRLGVDRIESLWLYLETKAVRRALPVRTTMTRETALEVIAPYAERARRLDLIERSCDAAQNVDECAAYGGCRYHQSAGGPCDASRGVRALYKQAKDRTMALDAALQAKFGVIAPPPAPPAAPASAQTAVASLPAKFAAAAPAAPPPTPAAEAAPAPVAEAAPPAVKRTRKPRATAPDGAPVAQSPAAPAGSLSERLQDAVDQLAYAESDVVVARERIAAILAGAA